MQLKPQRWLQSPEKFRRLHHNMVPFGRGTRQCVGMRIVNSASLWRLCSVNFQKGCTLGKQHRKIISRAIIRTTDGLNGSAYMEANASTRRPLSEHNIANMLYR